MALTNFSLLTDEQKTVWAVDTWREARNASMLQQLSRGDANGLVHRVEELRKTEKGARAVITLIHDLEGDGQVGDSELEGLEEELTSDDQVIQLDQMRHANRHKGRMEDQKSVVEFRSNSRNNLAYWLADRTDQLGLLTLAGRAYSFTNAGATRVGSNFPNLEFASDVTAPSSARYCAWKVGGLDVSGVSDAETGVQPPSWKMLVELKAYAKEQYMRPIRMDNSQGREIYVALMTPTAAAKLKQDPDYIEALKLARERSATNPLFKGGFVDVDGIVIMEHRHVFHAGSAVFSNAGANTYCSVAFCGAQALALADLGNPIWVEKKFDYDNQPGISIAKICGMLKPRFHSIYSNSVQDFGVINCLVNQGG